MHQKSRSQLRHELGKLTYTPGCAITVLTKHFEKLSEELQMSDADKIESFLRMLPQQIKLFVAGQPNSDTIQGLCTAIKKYQNILEVAEHSTSFKTVSFLGDGTQDHELCNICNQVHTGDICQKLKDIISAEVLMQKLSLGQREERRSPSPGRVIDRYGARNRQRSPSPYRQNNPRHYSRDRNFQNNRNYNKNYVRSSKGIYNQNRYRYPNQRNRWQAPNRWNGQSWYQDMGHMIDRPQYRPRRTGYQLPDRQEAYMGFGNPVYGQTCPYNHHAGSQNQCHIVPSQQSQALPQNNQDQDF